MDGSRAGSFEGTTRVRGVILAMIFVAAAGAIFRAGHASAQAGKPPAGSGAAPAAGIEPHATLSQIMQGTLYFNANVIFRAQSHDPAAEIPDPDPTMVTKSTSPPTSIFGGWTAVENSGMALTEAANLLMIPGRLCSNGRPVPLEKPDWAQLVQGLREAGVAAYQAAHAKNQEAIVDASDQITTACNNCHRVYRRPVCGGDAQGQ